LAIVLHVSQKKRVGASAGAAAGCSGSGATSGSGEPLEFRERLRMYSDIDSSCSVALALICRRCSSVTLKMILGIYNLEVMPYVYIRLGCEGEICGGAGTPAGFVGKGMAVATAKAGFVNQRKRWGWG